MPVLTRRYWQWRPAPPGSPAASIAAFDRIVGLDRRHRHARTTLDALATAGLAADVGTLHLDRACDSGAVRRRLVARDLTGFEIQKRDTKVAGVKKQPLRLGLRWIVGATNTWWVELRPALPEHDRKTCQRHAALCLATPILIIGCQIDWRNRWSRPPG